ncbi:MAG TPA: ribosome biogenesis GTPase YlqF [Polyangia bacterium]
MSIEWFPGHMLAARKAAMETMRRTDVVIEVLDARVPHSSCNPDFEKLRRENQRPALKVLNKADLADPERTRRWLAELNARPGVGAIALSAKSRGEVRRILPACLALAPGRTTPARPLRMLILGVPNAGKSTLMNTLLNRRVAKVGDEPAITKSQMRHEIGPSMWLVDTPGMLWPGLAQEVALKLAAVHSIGRNAYDDESVAVALAQYLLDDYPEQVTARFGALPPGADGYALIAAIAQRRSLVVKGGGPDVGKAASVVLNEFRAGVVGRITLETVEQVAARRPRPSPPTSTGRGG